MDHNVHGDITKGLRERGVDCLTLEEDSNKDAPDEVVLARAIALRRVVVTSDSDFLRITTQWVRTGREFAGVVYFPQNRLSVGALIDQLEFIAFASLPGELKNALKRLPIF
jgi:hypothetical protein